MLSAFFSDFTNIEPAGRRWVLFHPGPLQADFQAHNHQIQNEGAFFPLVTYYRNGLDFDLSPGL